MAMICISVIQSYVKRYYAGYTKDTCVVPRHITFFKKIHFLTFKDILTFWYSVFRFMLNILNLLFVQVMNKFSKA
jgi:hypothetical protein